MRWFKQSRIKTLKMRISDLQVEIDEREIMLGRIVPGTGHEAKINLAENILNLRIKQGKLNNRLKELQS